MLQQNLRRRSVRYPGRDTTMYLPKFIWEQTLNEFRKYAVHDSECLVFWGGIIGAVSEQYVTSLLKIHHRPQGWRVQPTKKQMLSVVKTLHKRDEKLLAQVHSHPEDAFHSWGDDRFPISFFDGFFSIVVPHFGIGIDSVTQCAVYQFCDVFEQVKTEAIEEKIIVFDQLEDL